MQISNAIEDSPKGRKMYVGVENFYPTAVNPTLTELNAMGIPATQEPTYHGKVKRDYGQGEQEYEYFSIRVFLDNKDPARTIKTQVQYTVLKDYRFSKTGKFLVLNKYGNNAWLEDTAITSGVLPSNMQWYLAEDIKKAYRGEDSFIDFIKALRNLPNIGNKTKELDKPKGIINFDQVDLDKLFKGDFKAIRKIIMDTSKYKVGFLLGIKTIDGKNRQALYNRLPLKPYVRATNNTDYLIAQVTDAQDNGSYADTYFDLTDTTLKEYDETAVLPVEASIHDTGGVDDLPF